jgi:Ca-activated chloride channel family protein
MKFASLTILFLVASAAGQSGRIKPAETPKPGPTPKGIVIYIPTQDNTRARVSASPTPKTKAADDDGEIVKVDSTLVPIPVSVVDAAGRSINNLRLTDFELKIDGKLVEIGEVSRSETPIRLAMLFDNSGSVTAAREFEKDAAIKFFQRIIRPEKDLAALYKVSTVTRLEQPFTKDISLLVSAIQFFPPPGGATALLDGIVLSTDYLAESSGGRRVVVIVSDGDDTASDATLEQTLKALHMANCQLFVVKTTDFENFVRTRSRAGNANIRQLIGERRMLELTKQTGGAVYSPIDERELDEAFRQISAELSQQYILSYYPENEAELKGQFREITLTVKNKPNLTVRTRKGYYVPKK